MFGFATSATPDTSQWDTTSVIDMSYMFYNALSANPDTSNWNTSAVSDMSHMFGSSSFLQPLIANPDTSGWDTSAVTNMEGMFEYATSFNRNIGSWDVTSLHNAEGMFTGVTLSPANYESLLVGWNAQALQSGVTFSGGKSTYCLETATAARANMIASYEWVITDGGRYCSPAMTCDVNMVSGTTEYFNATYEACEILVLGPDFTAADGSNVSANSGWDIEFLPGFKVEQGATLKASVCGQSLCMTSPDPMPYGCHSCVDQICDMEPTCCELEFDQSCLDKVSEVCGLLCEYVNN